MRLIFPREWVKQSVGRRHRIDDTIGGGSGRGRTALPVGRPGFGETGLAPRFSVQGVHDCKDPRISCATLVYELQPR
jgi:KaiC/GvpD/RAD55 family RecA-like ATPase